MAKITYKVPAAIIYVRVDGNHVGSIRHNEYTDTWSYKPEKSNTRGDEFSTLAECKASLEDDFDG